MAETILQAIGLQKKFPLPKGGQVEAVRRVSFEVKKGEIFGFLGPNGAGKSTVIGMLTTQIRPTSGEVILAGQPIWQDLGYTRPRISVVAQHNNLDRSLTARENLLFHARYFNLPHHEAVERAERYLKLMGLLGRADDPVGAFSGGMAQRLKIARALMHDPEILFLDEPTTGLDPQSRELLWDEIKRVNKSGTTIFLTTHYMEEPEQLCDRVAILHEGEVKALDTPARLQELISGQNVLSIRVVNVVEGLLQEVKKLPGVIDVAAEMNTLRLTMRDATPDLGGIVDWFGQRDVKILSLNLQGRTLNDVFVHLTGRELEQQ